MTKINDLDSLIEALKIIRRGHGGRLPVNASGNSEAGMHILAAVEWEGAAVLILDTGPHCSACRRGCDS